MKVTDVQRGVLALLIVTVVWGTTFPATKLLSSEFNALQIIALRFGVALIVLLPLLWRTRATEWRWGLGLGSLLFIAFALQMEGLAHTSSNRNAFVTGLNVLLVPLLGLLIGQRPGWLLCFLSVAMAGMAGLFWEDAPWGWGDTLTWQHLFFALYIHALASAGVRNPHAPLRALHLTATQAVAMLALSCSVLSVGQQGLPWNNLQAASAAQWLSLLYLGTAASVMVVALQAWGQRHVPATPSAIIFGLEPVFAVASAWVLLGERLGAMAWVGAGLIVLALVLSQWPTRRGPSILAHDRASAS
ncbi:MAG: DMT family transporter [Rhodoferax sp.]|nr:DMT family transporter [Rhodoferax sp.]